MLPVVRGKWREKPQDTHAANGNYRGWTHMGIIQHKSTGSHAVNISNAYKAICSLKPFIFVGTMYSRAL